MDRLDELWLNMADMSCLVEGGRGVPCCFVCEISFALGVNKQICM